MVMFDRTMQTGREETSLFRGTSYKHRQVPISETNLAYFVKSSGPGLER